MLRLPLAFLRWKMEVRERLEAVWENRWAGIVIAFAFAMVVTRLLWDVPSPGVSVAFMGVAAAIMAARIKATGIEKATWTLIIFALLVVELAAIKKERFLAEQAENTRTREERRHFSEVGTGITQGVEGILKQSHDEFQQTIDDQSTKFATTMKQMQRGINATTGGDSFAIVLADTSDRPDAKKLPLTASLCFGCTDAMADVAITITANNSSENITVFRGTIDPGVSYPLTNFFLAVDPNVERDYTIKVYARNGVTLQALGIRLSSKKEWELRYRIERITKYPHLNEKTGMAEGMVNKLLSESPWMPGPKLTPINPQKTTVIH